MVLIETNHSGTRTGSVRPRHASRRWALLFALAAVLASTSAHAADPNELKQSMQSIFASIQVLLPLSVDDEAFADPANQERIAKALENLSQRAGEVSGHAGGEGDRRIQHLAASLERDTRETERRFLEGEVEGAQFFVQRVTDFCVACHSRLPSEKDSPIATDFVSEGDLAALRPERRATLQVATRRFDQGLTTWEDWFATSTSHPADLLNPLTSYLTVAIRVKNDLERPVPTLEKLWGRPDVWTQLRGDLQQWVNTLRTRAAMPERPPSIGHAKETLDEALAIREFPSDRGALVHYLLASGELHRWLEANESAGSPELAEAYYWLGVTETHIGRSYWVTESDFYLETAIRLAPDTDVGRRAYALLEEETLLGWTGSAGTRVPSDVQAHLDELRALVEAE